MLFMWSKVESFFKIMHGNSCVLGKPLFYPCLFPAQTDFCGGQPGTTTRVCGSGTDTQGGLGGGWDRPTREAELEQEPRMEGSATEPTPQPPPRGQAHTRAHTFPYLVQAL